MDFRQAQTEKKRRGPKRIGDHILSGMETNRRFQDKAASIDQQLDDARSKINWKRRKEAEADIVLWVNTYCIGAFLDEPPPPLGEKIIREMWQAVKDSRPYLIEQARGSGKTSYIESVVTAAIAQGERKFPLLIGENASSAQNLLTDIFRIVMDDGPFSQDYPDLCLPFQLCNGSFRRRQTYKGVMTDIVKNASRLVFARITNDDGTETLTSNSLIQTRGITSGLRGLKFRTFRPDLIILDDIQNDETAESQEQVEKLLSIINKGIMNVGGKGKIACLQAATPIAPDDLVERLSKDKAWKTTKFPAIITWPKDYKDDPDNGLWAQYFKIYDEENACDLNHEKSLRFYKRHQKKMDKDVVVLNPNRYKESDGHISAIQSLMDKLHQIGESAFYSEYQMEPKRIDLALNITPKDVVDKINNDVKSYCIPDGYLYTCATLDLNTSYAGTLTVTSFKPDSSCVVLGHKIFRMNIDQQLPPVQYNQLVYDQLDKITKYLKEKKIRLNAFGIDGGGRNLKVVCEFAKNCSSVYGIPCCAMMGRSSTNFNPNYKSRLRNAIGRTVLCGDAREHIQSGSGDKWMFFDSDYFKESAHRSLLAPIGSPGGCCLYKDLPLNHMDFANQVCNERLRWKRTLSNGKTEFNWISKEPHDFLDCMAMAKAISESEGMSQVLITPVQRRKVPKRISIRKRVRLV